MKMFMAALAASLLLFSAAAPAESLSDDELKKRISSVLGQLEITSVKPTPIAGIREIIVGSDVLYATDDGKHVFQGSIYNIENGITDVTEASRSTLRRELMVGVTDDQTIVFDRWPVAAVLYMAVAGTAITFPLYFWLLQHMQARQLALIAYGTPVVALIVGAVFMDEPITRRTLMGSALVVVGVAIASSAGRASRLPFQPSREDRG